MKGSQDSQVNSGHAAGRVALEEADEFVAIHALTV
jgi:hypothetical protein